jgi:hypothetical protein
LDSLEARGEIRIDSARVGQASLEGLTFKGNLTSRKGSFALDGGLGGGQIEARGEADLVEGAAATIRGRLTNVDLAALLGDTVQSAVSAAFSGRLESADPLLASGSLDLSSSRYLALTLDSASIQADLRKEEASLEGTGFLPDSGVVQASARYETSGDGSRLHLDSLDYQHLDLAALFPAPDSTTVLSTNLNGRLVGSARRRERAWEARGTLTLAPSLMGNQPLSNGQLEAFLDSTRAEVTVELQTPEGGLSGEGRLEDIFTHPTLLVPDLRFRSLNLGALLGRADSSLILSGSLEGRLTGTQPEDMTGEGELRLASSRILGVSWLESVGTIRADSGQIRGVLEAAVEGGELHAQVEANLARELPTYQGQLSLRLPELKTGGAGQDPEGSLFARLRVRGEGLTPESAEGEAVLEVDSARWNGIPLEEGRMNLAMSGSEVRLDTLVLKSPAGSASAAGNLPFGSSEAGDGRVRFRGTLVRADLLADLVGAEILAVGQASVEGNARGRWEELEVEAGARISALLFNDVRVQGLELQGGFSRTVEGGLQEASAHLAVDRIRLPLAPIRRVEVELGLEDGEEVSVEASAVVDDLREARLSARVEEAKEPSAVRLEAFELRADQDLWRLAHPARIDLRNGLEIDSLLIAAEEQELRARGRVASRGPLDLQVALEGFEVATVADLLGYPTLRGEVTGSVNLTGTAEEPAASLEFRGSMEPPGAPPGDLTVQAQWREAKLDFQGDLALEGGPGARAQGTLPLDLSLAGQSQGFLEGEVLSMDAEADSLLLAWFDPFLPATMVRGLEGTISGDVEIRGTPGAPSLGGEMALKGASARIPELGVALEGGEALVSLEGEEVRIDSLRLRSGNGSLRGSGTLTLSGPRLPGYALSLRAREFEAMARSGVSATVSGEADLSGEGTRAALKGRIQVERADLYLGDLVTAPDVEPVTLEEEDYRELARVFGYQRPGLREPSSSLWDSASLDVEVRLGRASWVRQRSNPEMAVQFTGDVSVTKEPGDSLRLLGRIEGVPGRSYVEQFGRRFTLAQGEVNFRGTPAATQLDLRAEYEVPSHDNPGAPELVISLDLTGTPADLELALASTPTVAASDMISYLAAGRPAGQVLGGGDEGEEEGRGLTGAGEALALGRMSAAVEAYAREQVGLDVVEITTDGLDGVILLAGRYVSPELFLGVRQPLSLQRASGDASERAPNPEVEVEFEALRWLLLNLQAGSSDGLELFLRWRMGYD